MVRSTVLHAWSPVPLTTTHPVIISHGHGTTATQVPTAPPDSPFLTGKVDSQQDTLLCVLAPAAVHHHHVPDPLRPGALQAHGQLDPIFTTQKVDHYLKMLGQVTCMLVGMLKASLALRVVSLL